MMDTFIDSLNDISTVNIIYIIILITTTVNTSISLDDPIQFFIDITSLNLSSSMAELSPFEDPTFTETTIPTTTTPSATTLIADNNNAIDLLLDRDFKPSLLNRMAKRLVIILENVAIYLQNLLEEHTATSIASFSVLIIVLSIICCFVISLMREEERRIKEQYKKLNGGGTSSQSFITINGHRSSSSSGGGDSLASSSSGIGGTGLDTSIKSSYQAIRRNQCASPTANRILGAGGSLFSPSSNYKELGGSYGFSWMQNAPVNRTDSNKLHVIEMRRETYFGLVRLSKPGCRTVVLLCDAQSKLKLLAKFYQCIYPYRKNKTLQFAFLLIEKNINWYQDLLKYALNEKRDLHINPINCIGTVLVLNGFKKYFSVYHESDSNGGYQEEPFLLLEESLLDNFPNWLERLFSGKASRYYVKYWPDQMR